VGSFSVVLSSLLQENNAMVRIAAKGNICLIDLIFGFIIFSNY
jgi:hypothetical protein